MWNRILVCSRALPRTGFGAVYFICSAVGSASKQGIFGTLERIRTIVTIQFLPYPGRPTIAGRNLRLESVLLSTTSGLLPNDVLLVFPWPYSFAGYMPCAGVFCFCTPCKPLSYIFTPDYAVLSTQLLKSSYVCLSAPVRSVLLLHSHVHFLCVLYYVKVAGILHLLWYMLGELPTSRGFVSRRILCVCEPVCMNAYISLYMCRCHLPQSLCSMCLDIPPIGGQRRICPTEVPPSRIAYFSALVPS